jgi:hypothetical protein
MKQRKLNLMASAILTAFAVAGGSVAQAQIIDGDDGLVLMRNLMRTPDKLSEFANLQMARFYVPSQNSAGVLVPVVYTAIDGTPLFTRTQAKPLVAAFNDGLVVNPSWTNPVTGEVFEPAFAGHGKRDAYSSVSRDDGGTWYRPNLSSSGALPVGPVFVVSPEGNNKGQPVCDTTGLTGADIQTLLKNPTIERCDYFYYGDGVGEVGDPVYPHLVEEIKSGGGDVTMVGQSVVGNHIMVAWVSKQCAGINSPLNILDPLADPYDVKGRQGYTDYALMKAEGEIGISALMAVRAIGKVPHSCLWTRRGRIIEDILTGGARVQWYAPERLTSGVRDAYKLEVAGHENTGFSVVWQEDPDGLLPGSGEGPGEGWSGATVNHKTDVWYSFLHLKNFANTGPVMSVPVPITDNAKCPPDSGDQGKQYCYADNYSYSPATGWTLGADGTLDLCADVDFVYNTCIAQDGRYLEGQTGASRPRINIQPYCVGNNDPETWATACTDYSQWSAWAGISYEESKGKGDLIDENGQTLETGKNIRFHTFNFEQPEPIKQGLQLNAPTRRWPGFQVGVSVYDTSVDEAIPDPVNPGQPVYDRFIVYRPALYTNGIWNAPFFDTEIARRASIASNGVRAAVNSTYKTTFLGIFKQGLMNQGGPADVMFRRFVLPDNFQAGSDNLFGKMDCKRWATAAEVGVVNDISLVTNGLPNPNYLDGLCLEPPHNVSSNTPTTCDGVTVADPTGVSCGYGVTKPFLEEPLAVIKRMFTWTQSQGVQNPAPLVDDATTNVDDESWTNPWDVAKGHRGILDGDFIMLQYAWAPNEWANRVGRDAYNLYIRRSFDGGQTWTTTPAALGGDGTQNCETYRAPVIDIGVPGVTSLVPTCTNYAAGAMEPARDLSMILRKVAVGSYSLRTVLDPRYTPTGGLLKHPSTDFRLVGTTIVPPAAGQAHDAIWGDIRDRSKYFIAYDDGDNRTVAAGGEAEPIDMYYAQAYNWGDDYTGIAATYPAYGVTITRLQRLNALGTNASESSITANPGGGFLYAVWNQWQYTDPTDYTDGTYDSPVTNDDPIFRRLLFLDGQ